jgi:hypothetical protein
MVAQSIYDVVERYGKRLGARSPPTTCAARLPNWPTRAGRRSRQIQISLGHASIQTTERCLGIQQDLTDAPCDHLGIRVRSGLAGAIPQNADSRRAIHSYYGRDVQGSRLPTLISSGAVRRRRASMDSLVPRRQSPRLGVEAPILSGARRRPRGEALYGKLSYDPAHFAGHGLARAGLATVGL